MDYKKLSAPTKRRFVQLKAGEVFSFDKRKKKYIMLTPYRGGNTVGQYYHKGVRYEKSPDGIFDKTMCVVHGFINF